MNQPAFMCSRAAQARGDSMVATAPPAQRWLLIEQEGAWPINALDAFPTHVARRIAARAAAEDARVSLIRRPGRHPREDRPIRWAFADVRPGHEGIRWGSAASGADLLDMPWEVSPGEGEPVAIVCAHSRHDVCCAMKGRPVAQSLTAQWPGRVWECSHLGGDRFAATMVLLPSGLCFGRITVDNAGSVLDAYEQGRVVPELLRGRCAYTRQEQAAQSLARAQGSVPTASTRSSRWEPPSSTMQRSRSPSPQTPRSLSGRGRARCRWGPLPHAVRRCWPKPGNTPW